MSQYRQPAYGTLPPAVKNLIILNVICFVCFNLLQPQLQTFLALHLWGATNFAPHQLVTHLFMHSSLGHIFFNMFALWTFGSVLEQQWGTKRFLIYYFFTGIGAAILYSAAAYWELYPFIAPINQFLAQPDAASLQTLFQQDIFGALAYCKQFTDALVCPNIDSFQQNANLFIQNSDKSQLPLIMSFVYDYKAFMLNLRTAVGASGAVYGLIMAYAFIAPNQTLYFYGILPIKAKYFAVLLGGVALFMGIQNNPNDSIAHFAHLGGMVFGYILLKYWQKTNDIKRF
jgi:membrane associated rhomboid family serine protease